MIFIENEKLRVSIKSVGAEIKSIFHKQYGLNYMWNGNPDYWSKTSPVLFPIVGALKGNTYYYKGNSYCLPRHGFGRDQVFAIISQQKDTIEYSFESNEDTWKVFPFRFIFSIGYSLVDDELCVTYFIRNIDNEIMFFSLGGHPAFKVPLVEGTKYGDYQLRFEQNETADRWLISQDGLIEGESEPLLNSTNILPLNKELFNKDALILKRLRSEWVQLESIKTRRGLRFYFAGFPYLGLWAAPGADFICIEPWCGIADSVGTDQKLEHKEGILQLKGGEEFKISWKVKCY